MQNHYNYWKSKNINYKTRLLKKTLLTEIRNYKRRYTIYMLVCNITGDTYYGSTSCTLKERLNNHKCNPVCSAKIIIDRNDYLPLIPLETDLTYYEKREREEWYISNNVCVNILSAKINVQNRKNRKKQAFSKWYKNNKEYKKQCDYWRRGSPIGILARAYFD